MRKQRQYDGEWRPEASSPKSRGRIPEADQNVDTRKSPPVSAGREDDNQPWRNDVAYLQSRPQLGPPGWPAVDGYLPGARHVRSRVTATSPFGYYASSTDLQGERELGQQWPSRRVQSLFSQEQLNATYGQPSQIELSSDPVDTPPPRSSLLSASQPPSYSGERRYPGVISNASMASWTGYHPSPSWQGGSVCFGVALSPPAPVAYARYDARSQALLQTADRDRRRPPATLFSAASSQMLFSGEQMGQVTAYIACSSSQEDQIELSAGPEDTAPRGSAPLFTSAPSADLNVADLNVADNSTSFGRQTSEEMSCVSETGESSDEYDSDDPDDVSDASLNFDMSDSDMESDP